MKLSSIGLVILLVTLPLLAQQGAKLPDGYGDLNWGTNVKDAMSKIKGKIAFTDEKKVIRTQDGNLGYHYGFLYLDPKLLPGAAAPTTAPAQPAGGAQAPQPAPAESGKLFYVALKYPYLTLTEVKKKVEERYGQSTYENIKDNRGSIAWDSEKTIVILWVDQYENRAYTRRITYISKEIAKELNSYVEKIFSKEEIEVMKNLNP